LLTKQFQFSIENRITSPKQYRFLFSCAKRFSTSSFTFYLWANEHLVARLGVVVAKRNQKKAVARNRTKRLVRESFRLNKQRLCGFDLVVVARRSIDSMSSLAVRQDLERAWDRIKPC